MKIDSYAKINIGLDVIRRLPNGYHEVRIIMQTLDLSDELVIERTDKPGIFITTDRSDIPVNEDNLIYRAAKLLMDEFDLPGGLRVKLTKNIPVAAGLAGGSGNAAATLKAVNEMFDLGLTRQQLMDRGVKIGADVPFCIMGGCALSEGIGEVLTQIPQIPECVIVLAKPPVSVSTAYVYNHLRLDGDDHPDIDAIITAIRDGDIDKMAQSMGNLLESVTGPEHPVIGQIENIMTDSGATASMMSGSGPTVFGIFKTEEQAVDAYRKLEEYDDSLELFITRRSDGRA